MYTYWYFSPDCDRLWNWKKTRGVYISFQPSMAFCSGENNLALFQDKLDSIKLLNEKTEYFFTIAFASARKPYRMELLFTHKNGDFGADYALELHFWLTKRFTRTRGERRRFLASFTNGELARRLRGLSTLRNLLADLLFSLKSPPSARDKIKNSGELNDH